MSALRDILVDQDQPSAQFPPTFDISEPPRKRPRVNQACETCRERKTRCDGQQPVCKACDKRGVGSSCSYIRQKRPSMPASDAHPSPISHTTSPVRSARPFDGPGFAAINHRSFDLGPKSDDRQDSIDRPSSVTALFRSISDEPLKTPESINAAPRQIGQWRPTTYTRHTIAEPERLSTSNSVPTVLPRRRDADSYVQSYWESVHPMYPMLHKPSVMKAYEKLWSSDDDTPQTEFDERLFQATLNMIFAIGSRFSRIVPDEHKIATADDFYQRSRKIFCYDVLDTVSQPMIQLLLLTVVYLQSTHLATRCYNTLGLAARAAQSIGLHEKPVNNVSQLELEMRRRVWHTCVELDRICAWNYARPQCVLRSTLPYPSLIDDEYLQEQGQGIQPSDKEPILFVFVQSCHINDELSQFLAHRADMMKDAPPEHTQDGIRKLLDHALAVNRRIDDLEQRLPERLRVESKQFVSGPARMHQHIIQAKLHFIRFQAGKPLLFHNAEHNLTSVHREETSMDYDMMVKSAVQAIHSAQKIIVIMYGHLREGFLLDSFHVTHVAIGVLTVLLAALKVSSIGVNEASIEHSWDQAIRVIEHHIPLVGSARVAVRILQAMKRHALVSRADSASSADVHLPGAKSLAAESSDPTTNPINGYNFASDLTELCAGETITEVALSQFFSNMRWLDVPR